MYAQYLRFLPVAGLRFAFYALYPSPGRSATVQMRNYGTAGAFKTTKTHTKTTLYKSNAVQCLPVRIARNKADSVRTMLESDFCLKSHIISHLTTTADLLLHRNSKMT